MSFVVEASGRQDISSLTGRASSLEFGCYRHFVPNGTDVDHCVDLRQMFRWSGNRTMLMSLRHSPLGPIAVELNFRSRALHRSKTVAKRNVPIIRQLSA